MHTDIYGFNRMLEADETATLERLEYHTDLIFGLAGKYNGTIIKTMGDSLLIEFKNTIDAVKCGVAIQNRLFDFNRDSPDEKRLRLRIGIHLGDIWFFENDALGEGVNIASHLQSICKPGRVCISRDVYNQIANKLGLDIVNLGRASLKSINKEVYAYEILTRSSRAKADGSPAAAGGSGSSPNIGSEGLRDRIVNHIKFEGRHVPLRQIEEFFPGAGQKVANILGRLTERGILTRIDTENGEIEYGFSDFKSMDHQTSHRPWEHRHRPRSPEPPRYRREEEPEIESQAPESMTQERSPEGRHSPSPVRPASHLERKDESDRLDKELAQSTSFPIHLSIYLGVNGLLFLIYFLTTPGGHPWFLYPMGAWGIGLLSHLTDFITHRRHRREKAAGLTAEQRKILKKIHSGEKGWRGNLTAYIGVIGFLTMIYFIWTPFGPLWPVFPAAGWGLGLFFHGIAHFVRKSFLLGKLRLSGIKNRRWLRRHPPGPITQETAGEHGELKGLIEEATRIKKAILNDMGSSKQLQGQWKEELEPLMNNFITQITELNERNREFAGTIEGIRTENL